VGLSVTLSGITKSFGDGPVLKSVDLKVNEGELVSLLGPSGCGKSTLLRVIAGFERQEAGSVSLGETRIDNLPPWDRDLAMVFQSYALYPHLSVAENIGLPLEMTELSPLQRLPFMGLALPGARRIRRRIEERVTGTAKLTEIDHLLHRRPAQLSGGQRQRVALARAIVREPGVFLMDEPLSNLDAKLRIAMRSEIVALNRRLGATFLFVTHDQSDAMAMSDRIALMLDGSIRQIGTPEAIYETPDHIDVATFIGQPTINLLAAEADASGRIGAENAQALHLAGDMPSGPVTVAVRPEAFRPVARDLAGSVLTIPVQLERVERMGAEAFLHCRETSAGQAVTCRLSIDQFETVNAEGILSGPFRLAARERGVHVFGSNGGSVDVQPAGNARRELACQPQL